MERIPIEICTVCSRLMADPRILPCAHSFCLTCLESSSSTDMFACPTCHARFQIPEGGLKNLRKNEFIDRLTNHKRIAVTCNSCKKNQATKFCVDCTCNYCPTCLELHGKVPALKDHRLLDPTSTKIMKFSTCNEHPEPMNLFCEGCKVALCARCLALKHNVHKIKHVSEYFEMVKLNIEDNLKDTKQILESVIANYKNSVGTKHHNELKASNLKTKLKEKGEDLKKVVDSIVDESIRDIDDELLQNQSKADDVMKQLKIMEINLNAKIETFEQQLNDLNYENVVEIQPCAVGKIEIIPQCSENFTLSLHSETNEPRSHLKHLFGTLRKAVKVVKEKQLNSSFQSFALKENGVYLCECSPLVKMYSRHDWKYRKIFNFSDELSTTSDILILNNAIYVTGRSRQGATKVIKFDEMLEVAASKIYEVEYRGNVLKLSKSCDGDILLVLNDEIIQLAETGVVRKAIKLPFAICDALQIHEELFIVCCDTKVCAVDCNGLIITNYMPPDECLQINSPFCLAKDCNGNIYVGDQNTRSVYVLNCELDFVTHHILSDSVVKICSHESANMMSILTRSKMIEFGL